MYIRCHYALQNATYPTWPSFAPACQRFNNLLACRSAKLKHYHNANPKAARPTKLTIGFQAPCVGAALTDTCSGPLDVAVEPRANEFVFPLPTVDVLVVTEVATPPPDTLMLTGEGIE